MSACSGLPKGSRTMASELADSLDAAWAEVEAALPEGWLIVRLRRDWQIPSSPISGEWLTTWDVMASPDNGAALLEASGPSPAAALRALAASVKAAAGLVRPPR